MSEKDHASQSAARKAWEERKVAPALKRGPERKNEFRTTSGIDIERIYDPSNLDGIDYERDLGYPGEYPFTRGVQPTMYRGRLWTMRQYAGFGTAEESNKRYRYLFDQGQTGLSVAFDLPTQMGRDADHLLAGGEVGRVGVSIGSLADMEILLDGLPLDKISTSMTINATAAWLLALGVGLRRLKLAAQLGRGRRCRMVRQVGVLEDRGDRVEPETVHAHVQPEANSVPHRALDVGVAPIQVGLLFEEEVIVILAGGLVQLPGRTAED